ncbi:hypothetical protein V9L05_05905 [Bernardetia sp. Wsw4-3y2]|uniref:hypothetical protein n=1 Tax=Bernardetia sp. Wsw4-3y2 TaxID=3127471 RepID=UPI0030CDB6AC
MDKETVSYIINYFSNLMTDDEKLALKHHMYIWKTNENLEMRHIMTQRGWISTEPKIINFLKDGYQEFELNVARRIMSETPKKVFLNNCPKCNKLARTPYARQCRHCGYSWHNLIVAKFKLNRSFQLIDRPFFLLGEITKGEVKQGQFMDLRMLGLNKTPKIEAVEFAFKRQDGENYNEIGLGTNELTEEDKEYLKNVGSFGTPFDIINKPISNSI